MSLGEQGAEVLFTYFSNHEGADSGAAESVGAKAHVCRCHLGKEGAVKKLVAEARQRLGRVDILVHNAASGVLKPVEQLTPKHWDWTHHQCASIFLGARAFGRAHIDGTGWANHRAELCGGGEGHPQYSAIGTSKAALEWRFVIWRSNWVRGVITANVVSPGVIDTATLKRFPHREDLLKVARRTPLGRLTTPADVAALVSFLSTRSAITDRLMWMVAVQLADAQCFKKT